VLGKHRSTIVKIAESGGGESGRTEITVAEETDRLEMGGEKKTGSSPGLAAVFGGLLYRNGRDQGGQRWEGNMMRQQLPSLSVDMKPISP
jgi:hypothetical protein